MKKLLERSLAIAGRHLPDVLALFISILFFLIVSGYFITEKGLFQKLFATGAGFLGGLVGGGIIGWIVGGIGVAAMGTAVGIGAIGALVIGGITGAVFGMLMGASLSFVQMLRNPSDFDVNWLALAFVLLGAAIVFLAVRWVTNWIIHKMPGLARRFLTRQGNTRPDA
ncbi:hypothetical protein [Rhodosalinus sp. K401]|uniref:hypothetical protein n=1 Tax=Rhodosalinus sp. K401 TaxID=3239195 RepID=UPI0035268CAE